MWTANGDWYVEYEGEEKELYDVGADPYQLENLTGTRPEAEATLSARLEGLKTCARNSCRVAEDKPNPLGGSAPCEHVRRPRISRTPRGRTAGAFPGLST